MTFLARLVSGKVDQSDGMLASAALINKRPTAPSA
jgi:hypothetical protein